MKLSIFGSRLSVKSLSLLMMLSCTQKIVRRRFVPRRQQSAISNQLRAPRGVGPGKQTEVVFAKAIALPSSGGTLRSRFSLV